MMRLITHVYAMCFVCMLTYSNTIADNVTGDDIYVYDRLVTSILSDYVKSVRPRCNNSAVHVSVDMSLRQVTDLDEPKQSLKANVWIRMNWTDCRLAWNSSQYDGIDKIVLPASEIWIPDLTLYENADKSDGNMFYHAAAITESGFVDFRFPKIFISLCRMNIRLFPFDKQNCGLTLGSWAYSQADLDIDKANQYGSLTHFEEQVGWHVTSLTATKHTKLYEGIPYSTVTFGIHLKRKPLFHGINLLLPWVIMSSIATLAFLLPVEDNSKVDLQVTVLLSLVVFQLVIVELLPASSETYPLISAYFAVSMILVAFSLLATVITINRFFEGILRKEICVLTKSSLFNKIRRAMRVRHPDETTTQPAAEGNTERSDGAVTEFTNKMYDVNLRVGETHSTNDQPTNSTEVHSGQNTVDDGALNGILKLCQHMSMVLNKVTTHMQDQADAKKVKENWKFIVITLDRLFLLVFLLLSVLLACCFMGVVAIS